MGKKRIVSGMRPTGKLHLGHLHGALSNWMELQKEYECFFFIADWHALTSEYANTGTIRESTFEIIIDWISVGLDPDVATFFVQSQIKEHSELHLLLSMITPLPWLERNPTYKEQLRELTQRDVYTYGFLGYPVLQAADILMYKANGVPVGEDQAPHVELTREIARRFNHLYGQVFPEPDTLLAPTSKILGTDRRKMSKSYNNALFLSDSIEDTEKKVSQMITDPQRARKTDPGRPEICNVFSFHEIYTPREVLLQIDEDCRNASIGCVECKKRMSENLNKALEPIRAKRAELEADMNYVREVVENGNARAREVAQKTMIEVREAVKI
ncbi:MAG: tryptophan--tRNA ligase [Deltaproteobacteria bacterium]|nr:tryptophan--tRNA ligase [Deltaproteobacteria bacterium]MBW2016773.1 tryptophan--tRNA ligase [Deltaproteobacteria bacterium]MBW2130782.1 tryptophan--tRNA ligase [Deltaproteobacteria bacterium]MBW2304200.1 tryptophan--tRNA ligase [Deltaproteobacteria bacterium]